MITAQIVKELREKTGLSVLECKKALEQAEGDQAKAKYFKRSNPSPGGKKIRTPGATRHY